MQDLKRSDRSDQTREAAEIIRLARRVSMSAGLERSFKIAAGAVDARRFLISMAPRPGFRDVLDNGLKALSFPFSLRPALEEGLKRSRFLHLGYAQKNDRQVCKLYCEATPAEGARVKIYLGFKWRPGDPDEFAIDEYWRLDGLDETAVRAQIAQTLAPNPDLSAAVESVLGRALARVPVSDLFFQEVLRGGVRRSVDMRLYDAGLVLDDVKEVAEAAAAALGAGRIDDIFARHGGESLGHVSAGPGFVTFYHGAGDL